MNHFFYLRTGAVLASLLLAGCQMGPAPADNSIPKPPEVKSLSVAQVETPPAPTATSAREKIGLCQSELASLKQVNPKAYAARSASFDSLVNSAGVYTQVRGNVSTGTKDTLDALYKYKTNQMCSEIERDVMQALIRRGEDIK